MMRGELRGKLIDAVRSYTAEVEKERDYWHSLAKSYEHTILKFMEAAKENADAIEPERKKGRWIRKDDGHFLQCEFCNRVIREPFGYRFKFCPNCGADMREDNAETD